jgi:hypothetical protein
MVLFQKVNLLVESVELSLEGRFLAGILAGQIITVFKISGQLGISGCKGVYPGLRRFEFFGTYTRKKEYGKST